PGEIATRLDDRAVGDGRHPAQARRATIDELLRQDANGPDGPDHDRLTQRPGTAAPERVQGDARRLRSRGCLWRGTSTRSIRAVGRALRRHGRKGYGPGALARHQPARAIE